MASNRRLQVRVLIYPLMACLLIAVGVVILQMRKTGGLSSADDDRGVDGGGPVRSAPPSELQVMENRSETESEEPNSTSSERNAIAAPVLTVVVVDEGQRPISEAVCKWSPLPPEDFSGLY